MKKKFNKTDLPHELPVFPLSNAIFFPKTLLPLNIFEPRYKQMTEHAVNGNKLIGMVQANQRTDEKGKAAKPADAAGCTSDLRTACRVGSMMTIGRASGGAPGAGRALTKGTRRPAPHTT